VTATQRFVVALMLVLTLALAASPVAAQDEIPDQCRTIIGCADAGPKPENPGDRGGYAQLLTLVVLAGGVGFIMTKVIRAARDSQAKLRE
jgi:hypothetical protein